MTRPQSTEWNMTLFNICRCVTFYKSGFIHVLYMYLVNPSTKRSHSSHSLWHAGDLEHGENKQNILSSITHHPTRLWKLLSTSVAARSRVRIISLTNSDLPRIWLSWVPRRQSSRLFPFTFEVAVWDICTLQIRHFRKHQLADSYVPRHPVVDTAAIFGKLPWIHSTKYFVYFCTSYMQSVQERHAREIDFALRWIKIM